MMKTHRSPLFLLLGFFCLLSISRSASSSPSSVSRESLGISPEDLKYFKSDIIKCKDGSKKFTKAQLNDDFCDCQDGTDEPGTSACARGKFYCKNSGHAPLSIFSSRVNDGICDCCDGSDEYDGKVKCQNTCWEAGKAARDKLVKKIATYKEGVIIRKKEIEQAKESIPKDQSELSKLKSDEKILKGLVQQLKDRKEQIEKAEERERLEKEKEEKKKKESEEKLNGQEKESTESQHDEHHDTVESSEEPSLEQDESEFNDHDAVEAANDDDSDHETSHSHGAEKHAANDQKTMVETESIEGVDESNKFADEVVDESNTSPDVAKQAIDESENTEGLSKEELGRLVASRWTGERSGDETKDVNDAKKEEQTEAQETEENEPDEDYDGYNSSEDNEKYNEDVPEEEDVDDDFDHSNSDDSYKSDVEDQADFSDITTTGSSSWLYKIQQTVRNILQAVNLFQTPVDKSEAAHVRKEYDDASAKLSKIQSRISSLNQKLERDYGPEKEFYSFYDRCFENKQNKYVYKVCPFKKASQVEGHSTTQLGYWDKFEDSYRTMLFSNGDKCWNGPDRSLKVKLRCGLNNELTDVDEPSRCEYVAILSTPALCQDEKLKELQNKLDLMNKDQPNSHDEL